MAVFYRYVMALGALCFTFAPAAVSPASGQNIITDQPIRDASAQLRSRNTTNQSIDGFTIAPGIIVSVGGGSESGYDSNPNQLDDGPSSYYSRINGYSQLTAIRENSLTRVRVEGVGLAFTDDDVGRTERGLGQATAEHFQSLGHGWSLSFGGLYRYNGLSFVEDQVAGGFSEVNFTNDNIVSFVRGRYTSLRYLTDINLSGGVLNPLQQTDVFNLDRAEIGGGFLYGKSSPIAGFVEGVIADVDYVNTVDPDFINRDATDGFGKAGVRFTYVPSLQVDMGWRYNQRDLNNDPLLESYSSNDFDFALRWTPWPYFALAASYDRTIEEPSTFFSRLADTRTYAFNFKYAIDEQLAISADVRRRVFDEIGTPVSVPDIAYRIWDVNAEVTYDATRWAQYYAGLFYQSVSEESGDLDFSELRIGAGVRVALSENAPGPHDFFFGERRNSVRNFPQGATVDVSFGPAWFGLPEKNITTVIEGIGPGPGLAFDTADRQIEDHDGDVFGGRVGIIVDKAASYTFADGRSLSFGFDASYSYLKSGDRSACDFTATKDCVFVNVNDFDPFEENNTGLAGLLRTTTDRELHYWNVASFAQLSRMHGGGLKDDGFLQQMPWIIGVDLRGLNERTKLHSVDISVPDPVDINEELDTYYSGVFLGHRRSYQLGHGLTLHSDTRGGIYYANSNLGVNYRGFIPIEGDEFVLEQGRATDENEEAAFIGTANVRLDKVLSWGTIGLFGQLEYFSYVPDVRYNNDDFAEPGPPFGVIGTQKGTKIGSSDAFAASVGIQFSVPLN